MIDCLKSQQGDGNLSISETDWLSSAADRLP